MGSIIQCDSGGEKFIPWAKKKLGMWHVGMRRTGLRTLFRYVVATDGTEIFFNSFMLGRGQFRDKIRIRGAAGAIYIDNFTNLEVSSNLGVSWRELPKEYHGNYVGFLALGGKSLFKLVDGYPRGFVLSKDGGASWVDVELPAVPPGAFTDIRILQVFWVNQEAGVVGVTRQTSFGGGMNPYPGDKVYLLTCKVIDIQDVSKWTQVLVSDFEPTFISTYPRSAVTYFPVRFQLATGYSLVRMTETLDYTLPSGPATLDYKFDTTTDGITWVSAPAGWNPDGPATYFLPGLLAADTIIGYPQGWGTLGDTYVSVNGGTSFAKVPFPVDVIVTQDNIVLENGTILLGGTPVVPQPGLEIYAQLAMKSVDFGATWNLVAFGTPFNMSIGELIPLTKGQAIGIGTYGIYSLSTGGDVDVLPDPMPNGLSYDGVGNFNLDYSVAPYKDLESGHSQVVVVNYHLLGGSDATATFTVTRDASGLFSAIGFGPDGEGSGGGAMGVFYTSDSGLHWKLIYKGGIYTGSPWVVANFGKAGCW